MQNHKKSSSNRKYHIKVPYLGKFQLFWCKECNIPLLDEFECNICHQKGFKVPISPPGDVRPAFQRDIEILQTIIDQNFGLGLGKVVFSNKKVILLNKIGGLDRSEEVLMDGYILGLLIYQPILKRYEFHPRVIGGQYILKSLLQMQMKSQKSIWLSEEAIPFILDGKSVLAPGVVRISENIQSNDYCLLIPELQPDQCIGIGIAKANFTELQLMLQNKHGMIAKSKEVTKNRLESVSVPKAGQDLNLVYIANASYINSKVQMAMDFIRTTINDLKLPIAVAYSGGKDSLGVLILVWKTIGPQFKIFFADTGLELPEVIKNVHDVANFLHMEEQLIIRSAGEKFWELIQTFGPPARDYRFCCHSLKAQQIMDIINVIYDGKRVLVFLGQRKYESLNRAKEKLIYVNSFIPLQVAATPIKDWNALTLWLFLMNEKISNEKGSFQNFPITDLYFKGQERLGCYLCPAANLSSIEELKITHPQLYNRWLTFLEIYAVNHGILKEWVTYGFWRYKTPPPSWKEIMDALGYHPNQITGNNTEQLTLKITKGFEPCVKGGYSVKGRFSSPLNLEKVSPFLVPITEQTDFDEDLGVIHIEGLYKHINYTANLYSDGTIFFQSASKDIDHAKLFELIFASILRATQCNRCQTCVKICLQKACVDQNNEIQINGDLCNHCLKCITHCPLYPLVSSRIEQIKP